MSTAPRCSFYKAVIFMIKRAVSLALVFVLCFVLEAVAFAAEPVISVSGASASENELVTLKVSLKDNPGIASMKLVIDYDEKTLTLEDAGVEKAVTQVSGSMSGANEKDGKLILNWLSLTGSEFSSDGNFAEIKFRVKTGASSGDSPITVSYNADDVYNGKEVNVKFAVEDGIVKVNGSKKPSTETSSEAQSESEQPTQSQPSGEPDTGHQSEGDLPKPSVDPEKPEAAIECSHIFGDAETTKKPTCTEPGEALYICEVCGAENTEVIAPLGHKFGEWKTVSEPSEGGFGERERVCNLCGYSEKEQFKAGEEQPSEQEQPDIAETEATPAIKPSESKKESVSPVIIAAICAAALVAIGGATLISKKSK